MVFVLSAISPEKMHAALANVARVLKPGSGRLLFRDYAQGDLAQERHQVRGAVGGGSAGAAPGADAGLREAFVQGLRPGGPSAGVPPGAGGVAWKGVWRGGQCGEAAQATAWGPVGRHGLGRG